MKNILIKILLIEDNPGDARLVKEALAEAGASQFELAVVKDLAKGFKHLASHSIDVILLDMTLPDSTGFDTFQKVNEKAQKVPIILLTGLQDEEQATKAVREGAQDYLVKGQVDGNLLVHSIRYAIERKRMEQAIYLMSDTQRQIAHQEELVEIYQLVGKKIQELTGNSYVIISMLDDQLQAMKVVGLYGFGNLYKNLVRRFKVDPSKFVYYLKEMNDNELHQFRSGRLEKFKGGLYALLTRKVPKSICNAAEKQLKLNGIYIMGFVWQNVHYGILTLLAKDDIAPFKEMVETIMNQATVSIKRIRSENALRESESALKKAQQVAHVGSWAWHIQSNRLEGSDEMYRIFGIKREKFTGVLSDVLAYAIHPDDRATVEQWILSIREKKKPFPLEYRVVWPDETVRVVWSEAGGLILDKGGNPLTITGTAQDITMRKREEVETHRRLMDLQVLYESSLKLSSQLAPSDIGRLVIEILKEHIDWHHAVIRIKGEESDELEVIGFAAPNVTEDNYASEVERVNNYINRVGQGLTGWVIQQGEEVRSGDLSSDPRYVETYPGIRSGLYAPMITGLETIGSIGIESEIANAFDENDEQLLATLAKMTANAIHRSRLGEQTEHQLQRLAALRAIDQVISASIDLHLTLDIFLNNVAAQLGVDAALLLLVNPAMNILVYGAEYGFKSSIVKKIHERMGEGDAGRVVLDRTAISVSNLHLADKPFMHSEFDTDENFVICNAVPLIAKGQVKGVLEVFHRNLFKPDPEWLDFLATLAGQAAIAIDNSQLFESLQRSNFELSIAYDETIEGWSIALDMRDRETEGHTQRVTKITQQLGVSMGITGNELVHVRRGALLHDIGKMGVPDNILLKPGELTPEEWDIMRRHPQLAYDMLAPITFLRPAVDIPYCHHEKWDGTGYPRGLKGKDIPMSARIFAVVDVYDALTSDRPYRKAWSKEKALDHIREQSSKHFDPEVVNVFLKMISESN